MSSGKEKTLSTVYEPADIENRWSEFWIEEKIFTADASIEAPTYSVVIPPPNITGTLHLGHALNNTLQDIMVRYKKMEGFNVLWIPGVDHAGIATQNVVERMLHDEGTDRHKIGREKFIERVWQWREESGGAIVNQLKRLGASCDWTRLRFTMDEGLSRAVRKVFVELYRQGLIYRGDYIINWCPRCHTALSDLEVEAEEKDGNLWYIKYPESDGSGSVTVATTRPETMLGDVAVAVNPADERYAGLIGKKLLLPIIDREIPVIADETVEMEFGTGAVKITPAHDFNDFEMAKRHDLQSINIMDIEATMNENAGPYEGLTRFEARKKLTKELKDKGLLSKTEKYKVRLGSCYRCKTIVEPRLSKQWFVRVKPLSEEAIKAVEEERTVFVPKSWEKTYFEWMRNIRDWCISRQIWWGHRIPAWHCKECSHITVSTEEVSECDSCGGAVAQDEDVLDTWFSSALWPFTTLNWPEKSPELERFYPTSALFTSFDIIFFWVARMMMMGLKFMEEVPFKEVYIHALIRDAEGRKMSKSKGNVIDPLVMMDKYGTDALRFTLAAFAAQGRDIKLAEERIEGYRNFTNKIWNLARFTLMNVDEKAPPVLEEREISASDKWILSRLGHCISETKRAIESYEFDAAARATYGFVWHELCDWYVELIKPDLRGVSGVERKTTAASVLLKVLTDSLRLLHPFMPFITEEIYSYLPGAGETILKAGYPEILSEYAEYGKEAAIMETAMEVTRVIRAIRTEMNISPGTTLDAECITKDKSLGERLQSASKHVKNLARVERLTIKSADEVDEKPSKAAFAVAEGGEIEVFVPLKGLIDVEAESERLEKAIEKVDKELDIVARKLANESFIAKAPEEVVVKERSRREGLVEKRSKLEAGLKRLSEIA